MPYHLSEKPDHTSTSREELKEKITTSTIGRKRNAYTSPLQARNAGSGAIQSASNPMTPTGPGRGGRRRYR